MLFIKTGGGESQNMPFAFREKCPRDVLEARPGGELWNAFCGNSNAGKQKEPGLGLWRPGSNSHF